MPARHAAAVCRRQQRWSELVAAPETLVALGLGSRADLASALDMDVIRACHCNDRLCASIRSQKLRRISVGFEPKTPAYEVLAAHPEWPDACHTGLAPRNS